MSLRTTTWGERNSDYLQELKEEAVERGFHHPLIIDIGPGGVVNFLADLFPTGKKDGWEGGPKSGNIFFIK